MGFDSLFFLVQDSGGGSGAGLTSISASDEWQTIVVSGLTNADFSGRDFAGFTPLSFGFGFLSAGEIFSGDESIQVGIDNFEVRATLVPEPGSALLVALGTALIAVRRLRA